MDGGGGGKPGAAGGGCPARAACRRRTCHPSLKPASVKTIIASPSSRNRHPPGFTVLAAAGSCRRMIGIRADRSSNGGCAVFNKPQTKIQNDRPSAIAYRDCSAPVPAGTFLMHPMGGREIERTDRRIAGPFEPERWRDQAAMIIGSKAAPFRRIAGIPQAYRRHDDAKFSRHGNRRALEAGPILLQAPSQRALRSDPGRHQYRRFVKPRADAFAAALREVAVIEHVLKKVARLFRFRHAPTL